jgi:ParB family chromosome partitioning protein
MANKANLKSFDDIFKSSEQRTAEENEEKISGMPTSLSISKLKPFSKHPFKLYENEKMLGLADSIKEQGVIVPILVRPIKDDKYEYEIVAGHNRVQASRLAGIDDIPCNVRDMDDETATIAMVDTNLQQRDTILPSEKAWAYKYKMEAIKSQGKRTDLTLAQNGLKLHKQHSAEIIAENSNDSRNQIKRYIRLTNLIPELLDKVDERKLAFIPAVELSYLTKEQQGWLYDILSREEKFGVPVKQATKLKGISQGGNLTYEKIDKIIVQKNHEPPKAIKVPYKAIREFFPPDTTPKEFEQTIQDALTEYFKTHPQKHNQKITAIER